MVMATKSSTKKTTKTKHDLLYIMSNSCGWCKKADPVVDELISDGHKITKLDVMIPAEAEKANAAKTKHNAQCGTPLFLDAETGNSVCGFREKDVLEKWANGEEIPKPPPPPPPNDVETASDTEIEGWKKAYETWTKENDHLPKLLPFDQILERVTTAQKQRKAQAQNNPGGPPSNQPIPGQQIGAGPSNVNEDIKFNNDFYYVVVNGNKEVVVSDVNFIQKMKQQYFQREPDGRLSKVVGDTTFNKSNVGGQNVPSGTHSRMADNPTRTGPPKPSTPRKKAPIQSENVASQKVTDAKQASKTKKAATAKKSKSNKKTIESF
jgi:hypothetical protein